MHQHPGTCGGAGLLGKPGVIGVSVREQHRIEVAQVPAELPDRRDGVAVQDTKASNVFLETNRASLLSVADWSFLTNHARVLLCIAHDPGARLRDIAASLGITERSAYAIVTDLTKAGYVVKERDGRRNRYQIQAHLPLREPTSREPAIGEVLTVLLGSRDGLAGRAGLVAADRLSGGPADGADVGTAQADGAGGAPGERP
jgi:hypothetical protein